MYTKTLARQFKMFFLIVMFLAASKAQETLNDRPIIGVLAEELTDKMVANYGPHRSFIAGSSLQFVQGSGGRAVPILIGQNESYYDEILQYVNGVLFPGGSVWFDNTTGGYVEAGRKIVAAADKMNSEGDFFPLWGTCLGFELMAFLANNEQELRVNCSSYNVSNPLILTQEASTSRLLSQIPSDIKEFATTKNTTTNFHRFCITPKDMEDNLGKDWSILSTNIDDFGLEYVSTIEHKTKPYFGTQWHPEKPLYEWGHFAIPHDRYTVQVSQYLANFFVNQARRSHHKFPSEAIERQYLSYKFNATFGLATSTYTQFYFFD